MNKDNSNIKNNNNNEIHFITLWENDNSQSKKRLYSKIKDYNNDNIKIIQNIKINKSSIHKLFKNVNSGGKDNLHDIEVFIIEVPNIYKENKTHDYPEGEIVNDIMYSLKKYTRGEYTNYNIAHGSYNLKESNDFIKEYFKYLGNFNNYEELFNTLNDSNLFWFYDRVDLEIGDDIDLVTDSLLSCNFLLRRKDISNKAFISLNNNKKLIDLRDFDSNYYPKEWLQEIKKNNKIIVENNIRIPTLEDHFMLGLYHMYIHKNGQQNEKRLIKLNNMKKQLRYDNLDIRILFDFLNKHNYNIIKPNDENVGFHIDNMTRGGTKKQVYKYNDRYFYLYKNKENYDRYIKIINILSKYNFVPKILYKNDDSLVIEVENTGEILNKSHKINNLKIQIKNIISILKQNNIVHNDITLHNITIKDNNIYLIDFDHSYIIGDTKDERNDSQNDYYCKNLPQPINNNLNEYIDSNKCLYDWL